MAVYKMQAPDGATYQVEGPDGASDDDVRAEIIRQNPTLGAPTPTAPPKPQTALESFQQQAGDDLKKRATAPVIGPVGQLEAGVNMASGLASSAAGGLAGIAGSLLPGPEGQGADWTRRIQQAGTYQPRTAAGKLAAESAAAPMTVGSEVLGEGGGYLGELFGNEAAGRTIGESSLPIVATLFGLKAPLKSIATTPYKGFGDLPIPSITNARANAERTAPGPSVAAVSKAIEKYPQNAHRIEAAKDAQSLNIKVNPAESNPTPGNKAMSTLAGGKPAMDAATAIENMKVNVPNVVRKELGIPEGTVITKEVFDKVLGDAAAPAEQIKAIPVMVDTTGEVAAKLNSLRPGNIIGKGEATGAVNAMVDNALNDISGAVSGKDVMESIRQHREDARAVLSSKDVISPVDRAKANASKGIANALESMIDQHLAKSGNKPLLDAYRKGRVLQAKAYTWRDAWNADTGRFDPQVIARQTAGDSAITGDTAKIGKIANNFPGAMSEPSASVLQRMVDLAKTHYSRAGPLGIAGAAIGSLTPFPGGTAVGGLLGMGAGEIIAPFVRRGLMKEGSQATRVVPTVNSLVSPVNLAPKAPGVAVVPYVTPTEVVPPGQVPNFTFGKPDQPAPKVTAVGEDLSTPRIGMSREPVGGQMGALRAEDARVLAAQRKAAAAQDAAEAAKQSASRQPTGRGVQFDLDPVTGKLVPTSQGVKGATPEIWQANTGANLKSASEKVAAGRGFDMTAAEKVAWNKTSVDLKTVSPEFSKLTDKQILAKMQDREWVQDALNKAQQKAAMYDVLERQSQDRLAQSLARINREKMLDVVEQLQDTLGSRPSSRGYGQGPKTRAFQRGLLTGAE